MFFSSSAASDNSVNCQPAVAGARTLCPFLQDTRTAVSHGGFGMGADHSMFFFFPDTLNAFMQDQAGGCVLSHAEPSPQNYPPLFKIFPVTHSKRKALPRWQRVCLDLSCSEVLSITEEGFK